MDEGQRKITVELGMNNERTRFHPQRGSTGPQLMPGRLINKRIYTYNSVHEEGSAHLGQWGLDSSLDNVTKSGASKEK